MFRHPDRPIPRGLHGRRRRLDYAEEEGGADQGDAEAGGWQGS